MFKATKPFLNTITGYPQQPSLRIGRVVPQEAVNLAYYYNPSAIDAEKILTADAPSNTVDHRIEQDYRYLFSQASNDDSLFPGYVAYEDREGYTGKLGRMFVQWYSESHVETKAIEGIQQDIIVTDKSELPKTKSYSDVDGFEGTLYLDTSTFEVSKTKDNTTIEEVDRNVFNFELNYHDIYNRYIPSGPGGAIDYWMNSPDSGSSSPWPETIEISPSGCTAVGSCNSEVRSHINRKPNSFDKAIGTLKFLKTEYEPVDDGTSGSTAAAEPPSEIPFGDAIFTSNKVNYEGSLEGDLESSEVSAAIEAANKFVETETDNADNIFKEFYGAVYKSETGKYAYNEVPDGSSTAASDASFEEKIKDQNYGSIEEFLTLINDYCNIKTGSFVDKINEIVNSEDKNTDIAIYRTSFVHKIEESGTTSINSKMWFEATYKCMISTPFPGETQYAYNVVAVYSGTLKKTIQHTVKIPAEYKATCYYSGIARKVWETYDGMAYYRGSVTKGNSVGNMNPEEDNEILMFPDINGRLRRPVYHTDQNGRVSIRNFYNIETDYAYLTDVFKNGVACFWKYDLKNTLYDYRGPDERGFYEGDAVKLFTSALKDLPSGYEYNIKLIPNKCEKISQVVNGLVSHDVDKPVQYSAQLFTSFLSTATDTYKVTYNAFDDNDHDNVALNNGVTEEIYSCPYMIQGQDFIIDHINKEERISHITMKEYKNYIVDSRRYITFTYKVIAKRKQQYNSQSQTLQISKKAVTIESSPITATILNRDYAFPSEYNKFDGRCMIVSPQVGGIYQSPFDIILAHQATNSEQEVLITSKDTDFYFYTEIITCEDGSESGNRGGINLKCNPDGSGYITAETTIDTGFWNPVRQDWTKKLCMDNPYFIEQCYVPVVNSNGERVTEKKMCIFPGIKVKCIDARHIKVLPPRESGLLDSWYPRIQFGHYSQVLDQYGTHTKVCYSMPEYDADIRHFSSKYFAPYVDVEKEKVEVLNSHMVRTKCFPLRYINNLEAEDIKLYKKVGDQFYNIEIQDVSFSDGVIITKTAISENDNIVCDYTYLEESYVYRGYWRTKQDFARIDLNPNIYHTYSDMTYAPSETKPTKNLFNKVIYFYLRPTVIYETTSQSGDDLTSESDVSNSESEGTVKIVRNSDCLYHKIDDNTPDSDWDINIGSIYIRQNTSLHSTMLIDSRTRGGGLIESMKDNIRKQLEPESDYYLDIGFYDGEPYQENGVIIVRLDQRLLQEFGGRFTKGDIEIKVKRWLGYGVYPIIEYVDTYTKQDLPQHSLVVEDSYSNVIEITPEIEDIEEIKLETKDDS